MSDSIIIPPEPEVPTPVVVEAPAPAAPQIPEDYVPRTMLAEANREAAERRIALKPYEETFGGLEDDTRESLFELARLIKEDPDGVRGHLAQMAGVELPGPNYLTEDAAQRLMEQKLEERLSEVQQQQYIDEIYRQADTRGYKQGTPDATLFLQFLNEGEGVDFDAADQSVKAYKQALVQEYIDSKRSETENSVQTPQTQGQPARETPEPKNLREARAAALARLEGINRG